MLQNLKFILLALFLASCNAQDAPQSSPAPVDHRQDVIAVARASIGQREATGNNDGAFVERVLATCGLDGSGAPWCAAFNRFCYDEAGLRNVGPRSALAADWVRNPTWKQGKGPAPTRGDPFGLWFQSKGRVAHTGLIEKWDPPLATTIEGNTNDAGSREGDGVYRKKRLIRQIYASRNWF